MEHRLTTVDNPFSPFTDWDEWYRWDESAHYCSTGLLARIAVTSEELSDADQAQAVEDAIDEIVTINASGVHIKVTEGSWFSRVDNQSKS